MQKNMIFLDNRESVRQADNERQADLVAVAMFARMASRSTTSNGRWPVLPEKSVTGSGS
jgi:hypothetical protein